MRAWSGFWILCGVIAFSLAPQRVEGQPYELDWATVDGGGVTASSGGAYTLGGTVGQADAGSVASGGVYSLRGGFWAVFEEKPPLRFFRASTPGAGALARARASRESPGPADDSRAAALRGPRSARSCDGPGP